MSSTHYGRLNQIVPLADGLVAAARATTAARKIHQKARHARKGATLRPGPDTPLWNELVAVMRPAGRSKGN